ncbi:MAG: phosphomannomutase/phosphoglucomutase [Candidatus Aenigmarchaeota archaeon]|nr:phosphomannomutase/phosphoglucomutase [Candidatus Aenigmarchaeota archaeon]
MSIFQPYDIRGRYPKEINEDIVKDIAQRFVEMIERREKNKDIIISRDNRLSSPELAKAARDAITEFGYNVIDIGMAPISLFYFSMRKFKAPGIMITASHNPPDYNGIKPCWSDTMAFSQAEIQELSKKPKPRKVEQKGVVREEDVLQDYISYLRDRFSFTKSLKVVFDTGNGSVGPTLKAVMDSFGHDYKILFEEPDGSYPNHMPDPTKPENMKRLREAVLEGGADMGVGFDGDGDRSVFVDEKGNVILGDRILIIFAKQMLKENPGEKIIYDIRSTMALEGEIKKCGGIPIVSKAGRIFLREKLNKENGILAGETTSHFFFRENGGYDEGIFAALKMMEIIDTAGKLSELDSQIPRYFSSPDMRLSCKNKDEVVEKVKEYFEKNPKVKKIITIDGVKIIFENGWVLVRRSNTEEMINIRAEAKTKGTLDEIEELIMKQVEKVMVK